MTDLGLLHYYLGIEVDQKPVHFYFSEEICIGELLIKFGMKDCNHVSTPMEQNLKLTSNEGKHLKIQQSTETCWKFNLSYLLLVLT
jgi:hypothetical protein